MSGQVVASSNPPVSFTALVVIGVVISVVLLAMAIVAMLWPSTAADQLDVERARLYTHSEAFWGRWPNNRLFEAPYAELAAEATRCARLIEIFQEKLSSGERPERGPFRGMYDEASRNLPMYQSMLATVHSAMNYAISQGRGPQQPYGQFPSN
ncbi:hypothetical protein BVU76_18220 [Mycolicibacterium porcinum]|nr:hypothetical protein BVU76_18220 [Mycolicibacterium porcinum]